jgi:serine/threonine protein kinase
VAVKEVRIDQFSFVVELLTLHHHRHKNISKLKGVSMPSPYRIITRYCDGKSLYLRLHRKNADLPKLAATALTKIAYEVARGMKYLHKRETVHRELKTLNILLDSHGNAFVADFGLVLRIIPLLKY